MNNWKTTVAGIAAIVAAIGTALKATFDGDISTVADWNSVAVAIAAGIGLLFSKDHNK